MYIAPFSALGRKFKTLFGSFFNVMIKSVTLNYFSFKLKVKTFFE